MPPTPVWVWHSGNGLSRRSAMTWHPVPPSQSMEGWDAETEAVHAADQAIADDAFRGWGECPVHRTGAWRRAEHGAGVSRAAAAAGIIWPLAADVTDDSLVAQLFVNAGVRVGARFHAEPDWSALVRELKRPGVNLLVLWENTGRFTRRATRTAVFANCSASSSGVCRRRCGRATPPGIRRSLTTPASWCRSPTRLRVW